MNELQKAALQYAEMGIRIFPLIPRDKRPITSNGFKDASNDRDKIIQWWRENPTANIGIPMGQSNGGLVAIDLDEDDEKGKNGYQNFKDWVDENYLDLPDTWSSITGRGGYHYIFKSSYPVKSRIAWLQDVDVRADGSYIVAPPSIHPNGNSYEWEVAPWEADIAGGDDNEDIDFMFNEINSGYVSNSNTGKHFEMPEEVEQGGRNGMLMSQMGKIIRADPTLSEDMVKIMIRAYNTEKCKPPLPESELEKTIFKSIAGIKAKEIEKHPEIPEQKTEQDISREESIKIERLRPCNELLSEDIQELKVYIGEQGSDDPFLVEGTCILSAKSKLGKSWLSLEMCDAVSSGRDFLGYPTRKCSTLYLDLETKKPLKQKRLNKLIAALGHPLSDKFYIQDNALFLDDGLEEQIENYMKQDPDIGIIVIDVFQKIRRGKKRDENEYESTYRELGILNKIADKYHISIILVCHDRKTVDASDPFSNILGSTALQGATDQMIVMYKDKYNDDITNISVKGRTIDAIIDIKARMVNGVWTRASENDVVKERAKETYESNPIRQSIVAFMNKNSRWKGRCSELMQECKEIGYSIDEGPKEVGCFLYSMAKQMEEYDAIRVKRIKNGTGGSAYELIKVNVGNVDTVDDGFLTVDENVDENGGIPFI